MNKYTIFSDCHWNGVDPINVSPEFGARVIYIGDNFEFKNISKKRLAKAFDQYETFINRAKAGLSTVITGNHEVSVGTDERITKVIDGILFTHGHYALWSNKKIDKWEAMAPGRGFFARLFSKSLNGLRHLVPRKKLSKKEMRALASYARFYECHTICLGHTHPSILIDVTYKNIRIVNVPRGKTEVIL